jgi:hypothetical protein
MWTVINDKLGNSAEIREKGIGEATYFLVRKSTHIEPDLRFGEGTPIALPEANGIPRKSEGEEPEKKEIPKVTPKRILPKGILTFEYPLQRIVESGTLTELNRKWITG